MLKQNTGDAGIIIMRMRKFDIIIFLLLAIGISVHVSAQTLEQSKHNLSAQGPGTVKATSEPEICIFCHTPHSKNGPMTPLWNRDDPGVVYTLYNSSTIDAIPGQPDGSSILCLSCHDGTTALGSVKSRTTDIVFNNGVTTMPAGPSNLTTDLSDDHPVSFVYDPALAAKDGQLIDPSTIQKPITFENGKLQCISCHDPHSNQFIKFLVTTNQGSDLCIRCHNMNNWRTSSHNVSPAEWNGSGTNPWPHTPYTTVLDNACENCHNPHNAQGKVRLLNYLAEETNCLVCHNRNVAHTDLQSQFAKPYKHDVYAYNQVHDPTEDATVQTMHVECQDCHNPHAVRKSNVSAPDIKGFQTDVLGVNSAGAAVFPAQYEYEVCFRCHADSPVKPASPTSRQVAQNNVRLEFDMNNPSFHPVEGPGKNPNVPSLISPWTESSVMYCTDCHASDGAGSPKGPHGSNYPHILKYRYETADYTSESALNYELCYTCHDRNSILNDESFGRHYRHIVSEDTPCNVCHDPHGISNTQGNSTNNSHLINFDLNVVKPDRMGRLYFEDTGTFSGRCYLSCHGRNHPGWGY